MTNKKQISSLFVLKAVCAFMVVGIHTSPGGVVHDAIRPLFDIAVPFFYILTGYFLFDRIVDNASMLPNLRLRLTRMINKVLGSLVVTFSVYTLIDHIVVGREYSIETIKYYIRHLGQGTPVMGFHLWYISALFVALLLCRLFSFSTKGLRIILLVGLLLRGVAIFLPPTFSLGDFVGAPLLQNTLLGALPWLSVGYFVRAYIREEYLLYYRKSVWVIIILSLCAIFLGKGTWINLLGLTTLTPILFAYALIYPTYGAGSLWETIGIKYSQGIYYWHLLVVVLLAPPEVHISSPLNEVLLLLCIVLSTALSWLITQIQTRLQRVDLR